MKTKTRRSHDRDAPEANKIHKSEKKASLLSPYQTGAQIPEKRKPIAHIFSYRLAYRGIKSRKDDGNERCATACQRRLEKRTGDVWRLFFRFARTGVQVLACSYNRRRRS